MNRWDDLTEQEKQIVRAYVIDMKKQSTMCFEIGISKTQMVRAMQVIYRLLGLADRTELAMWVGRNWDLVNAVAKPKIVKAGAGA